VKSATMSGEGGAAGLAKRGFGGLMGRHAKPSSPDTSLRGTDRGSGRIPAEGSAATRQSSETQGSLRHSSDSDASFVQR